MEKCLTCGGEYPINELQDHANECEVAFENLKKEDHRRAKEREQATKAATQPIDLTSQDSEEDIEKEMVASAVRNSLESTNTPEYDGLMDEGGTHETLSGALNVVVGSAGSGLEQGSSGSPLQLLIREAQMQLSSLEVVVLEIRRVHVLTDAMREARKGKFLPTKMAMMKFVGEGGIDYGGPRCEFFRLLALSAKETLFIGTGDQKFFNTNVSAIQAQDFYNLGRYCSMSICQGGNGLPFMAEQVYDYLSTGKCTALTVDIDNVPGHILQFIIKKVDEVETNDDIKVIFSVDEAFELLYATGFRKAVCDLTLEDTAIIKSSLIDYHCILKVKAEMDQFLEGLESLGIIDAIKSQPEVMKPLFVAEISKTITAEELKEMLVVKYPESVPNKQRAEQASIHFVDFLDMCEEGSISCCIEDVLIFFTGADRVPPLGFSKPLTLSFLVDPTSKFATASTCDLQLRLPTGYGSSLNAFVEGMILSFKGNDGFGGV